MDIDINCKYKLACGVLTGKYKIEDQELQTDVFTRGKFATDPKYSPL